jgi:sulfur carrier protein
MRVTVNGEARQLPEPAFLAELLPTHCGGTAIALNGAVVPRARHRDTLLREGDVVEIVKAVQGG